jgi:haloacetate dehalogenase
MLEDYRAGLTIDRRHQGAGRAAETKLECPTLVLWPDHDDLEELHADPLATWANWAHHLAGHPIDSRHHMAEEAPTPLTEALATFLTANVAR